MANRTPKRPLLAAAAGRPVLDLGSQLWMAASSCRLDSTATLASESLGENNEHIDRKTTCQAVWGPPSPATPVARGRETGCIGKGALLAVSSAGTSAHDRATGEAG